MNRRSLLALLLLFTTSLPAAAQTGPSVERVVNSGEDWVLSAQQPQAVSLRLQAGQGTAYSDGSYEFVKRDGYGPSMDYFTYVKGTPSHPSSLVAGRLILAGDLLTNMQVCVVRRPPSVAVGGALSGLYLSTDDWDQVFANPDIETWLRGGPTPSYPTCTLTKVR